MENRYRLQKSFRKIILLPILLVAVVGCVPLRPIVDTSATAVAPAPVQPTGTALEEPAMSTTPSAASAPAPVRQAIADLADRLSLDEDAIELLSAEAVVWSDSSLGCPEPGMMYAQVIVEGMKIVLDVDGQTYHYHYGGDRAPFLCENPADKGSASSAASD